MLEEVRVPIDCDSDIVVARQKGRSLAAQLGFLSTDLTLIATAISELARNIVCYARRGVIHLRPISNDGTHNGLMIEARDDGPGIPNLSKALQDGYSTSGSLGLGLPGVRRLMDEFELKSEMGHGTVVTVRKWLKTP